MAGASTNKTLLLDAFCSKTINDTELLLLDDINSCSNLHLPYQKYAHFSLEDLNDGRRMEGRILVPQRRYIHITRYYENSRNTHMLQWCESNRNRGPKILLKRYSYPYRYLDLIPRLGRPVPELCMIANHVMNFIYERWHHLLTSINQPWLCLANLKRYANYIPQSGAPLEN